ncbi:PQQ-binding-like beta-propeller repeat protein (plasmid) [Acaryochloris sp. 'Moss Beach']|uniref:outer membrane protein assembly factor BamB family protein n=1 Tax=Acaryochloris sp. 'Moss Beach' TaxID=2740837 RepID=UPI001F2FB213|nr:PQQ-binding-like beta-propeller repeat protein [Acaryochloris sp. 'Moss Beach']UJB73114.1 PQQ-binding-like beta-propeller repeat protein [Acaryochloris sp. 'Moss Beach']
MYFKDGEKIQVRDAESGELKFQLSTPVKKIGLTGNTLLISDRNSVTAFDAKTGKNKWRSEGICGTGSIVNNLTTDSETLYIQCDHDPDFFHTSRYGIAAIKASNGKTKWFRQLKTGLFHTPSVTSEYVAVIDTTHQRWLSDSKSAVTIFSKRDGSVQSRFPISSASIDQPVSADQTHFYFVDRSPRWRHWISHWNPNWH